MVKKGDQITTRKDTGGFARPSASAGTKVTVSEVNYAGEVKGTFTDMWGKTHETRLSRGEY